MSRGNGISTSLRWGLFVLAGCGVFLVLVAYMYFSYYFSGDAPVGDDNVKSVLSENEEPLIPEDLFADGTAVLESGDQPPALPTNLPVIRTSDRAFVHLQFAPDSRCLLTRQIGGTLKSWDVRTGEELGSYPGTNTLGLRVDVSLDSKLALSFDQAKTIWLHEMPSLKTLRNLATPKTFGTLACGEATGRGKSAHFLNAEPPALTCACRLTVLLCTSQAASWT